MIKKLFVIITSAALVGAALGEPVKRSAESYYRQGLAAEKAGDPATAKAAYTAALRTNPNHANARYHLGQLKINSGSIAAKGRAAKFGAVMIPKFQMEGTTLKESLQALQVMVEKESKEEVAPNFIVQDPQGKLDAAKITLNLKNVPAKVVLTYVLEQGGAKARFDEHAILIQAR